MSKGMVRWLVLLGCGAILATGCAKKEMVKTEEPVTPTIAQPAEPTSKPAEPTQVPAMEEDAVQSQPVKEASVPVKEELTAQASTSVSALATIYFDFDSAVLSQASRDILNKNAEVLFKNNAVKIKIEGHCDERGSDEYNLALGERRARSAMNYLVTMGVKSGRLSIISYGKEKPVDQGHDEAAWAKNRRDEFVTAQ